MNFREIHRIQTQLFFITIFLFVKINAKDQTDSNFLATVGNKNITITEFKARCEFTIRPDHFKDKSVALNNLILEKILALEAGENPPIASNPVFQARWKGIKEQNMREVLYQNVAYDKTAVDTGKIKSTYSLSKREYELEFYRMPEKIAKKIQAVMDTASGKTENIFKSYSESIGKQPVKKVKYTDPDDDAIHESLYSKRLQIGDVIGPVELTNGEYLLMKVLNWTVYPLISETDQRERWNLVEEKEHRISALKAWKSYQSDLMHGKKIDFNEKTFYVLANWIREKYLTEQYKKNLADNKMPEIPFKASGLDLSAPFFTFEDKVWTVGDFRNELMSRPLLFRTTNLDSLNFNTEFKIAVADILRDHCLTREAYKRSLDTDENVTHTAEIWKDSFIATDQQKAVVEDAIKKGKVAADDATGILSYWESYVNDLEKKYKSTVRVNVSALQNIPLTKINMVAVKPRMPYPLIVPNFPTFVSSKSINFITQ